MQRKFSLSLVCVGVDVDVRINGARVVRGETRPTNAFRQLAPFVVGGPNVVEVDATCFRALGGRIRVRVLKGSDGSWATVAEESHEMQPGDPRWSASLHFVAPPEAPTGNRPARCEALDSSDQDEIETLLLAVHGAIARGEPESVLPLFSHWIDYYSRLRGVADDMTVGGLVDILETLGDPEASLAPLGSPALALVCGGGLCLATDEDGRPLLRSRAAGGEVRFPLVFGKLAGGWAIVA